jgi:histidine ammonia-lyase
MITLDGNSLSVAEVWQVADRHARCSLSNAARPLIRRSRELVDSLAATSRAIYGINTGFGPLSGFRVAHEDQGLLQRNLLHHLLVGQGALFSEAESRAIVLVRANTLARGFSGIREEVIESLLVALNGGIAPEIPCEGSVGASGDLVPLAHMAGFFVGIGYARVNGERLPAAEALEKVGLAPTILRCKEGLALVNGTSVMTALAALSAREAERQLRWMEVLTACLFQALDGEPEVLSPQVHEARGFRGQMLAAQRIRDCLRSAPDFGKRKPSPAWGPPVGQQPSAEVQDPYSLRCAPPILGAFQEALWHVSEVVTRELNASTDNPLVFPDTEAVIHGGNFYGQQIAMVSDYMRIGLIKMALLAERQIERLVNWRVSRGLPPMLAGGAPGLNSGFAGAQLLATSLAAEARLLGTPASIQTIATNANNQDVVSMGCHAARMTRTVVSHLWRILSIQALALAQAVDLGGRSVTGSDYGKLYDLVRDLSPKLEGDRPLVHDIQEVTALLKSEEAQEHLGLHVGGRNVGLQPQR